jgi:hypothetical protein
MSCREFSASRRETCPARSGSPSMPARWRHIYCRRPLQDAPCAIWTLKTYAGSTAAIITMPRRCVIAVFQKNTRCLITGLRQKIPRRKKGRPDQKTTKHLQPDCNAPSDISSNCGLPPVRNAAHIGVGLALTGQSCMNMRPGQVGTTRIYPDRVCWAQWRALADKRFLRAQHGARRLAAGQREPILGLAAGASARLAHPHHCGLATTQLPRHQSPCPCHRAVGLTADRLPDRPVARQHQSMASVGAATIPGVQLGV